MMSGYFIHGGSSPKFYLMFDRSQDFTKWQPLQNGLYHDELRHFNIRENEGGTSKGKTVAVFFSPTVRKMRRAVALDLHELGVYHTCC